MKHFIKIYALFFLLFLFSCSEEKKQLPVFELMKNSGINFENNVEDEKLDNSFLFRNFYNGGGVAIGDLNNDGLADVMLTANMSANKLFLNKGNFKFEDITAKAGLIYDSLWSTGVTFVDINNDGWLDIYVCSSGHMNTGKRMNKLYINNHNLTFTEASKEYGLDISAYSTQVSFFDYDDDGDLDCFMINNSPIPVNQVNYVNQRRDLPEQDWPVANFLKGGGDHLFRNDDGHFNEVTKQAGIHGSLISFGLGVSVADINNDGWPDVYVSNDSYERDYLYINQKNGTFKDEFENCFEHTSMSSMGADVADINNDGYPDIFNTDMLPLNDYRLKTTGAFDNIDLFRNKISSGLYYQYVKNCLQLNSGENKFLEIGNYSGVSATDWSWGALLFDADNDGLNDIYVCNGVNRDVTNLDFLNFFANDALQAMARTGEKKDVDEILKKIPRTALPNKFFKNDGKLKFEDAGESFGFGDASFSNGAAYADLDNDGDLDLIVNNENQPAFVYRNNSSQIEKNNYISIFLKGNNKNTFAIGSKIKVFIGDSVLWREVVPSRGFQSSVDYKQIIGLGKTGKVDSLEILWPNKTISIFHQPAIDTFHIIEQPDNNSYKFYSQNNFTKMLFDSLNNIFDKHEEDDYVDFYYERNIPEMLSREGPRAAIGDVNGDGLNDVYIGGTSVHAGQLYIQSSNGTFSKKNEPVFNQFPDFEDEAVTFIDADNDGDLDLFIGPGGNNAQPFSRQMQNRLFKNDGKGNFAIFSNAFASSRNGVNTGVALPLDFNNDGYTDLFVGGRSVPLQYGSVPSSFLYLNDGTGHFKDIAATKNTDIAKIGMVTGAVFTDVTGDKKNDLVITGEWMNTRIFSYNGDHFVEVKSNLNNLFGWWQTITATDINNDGRQDLILGNIGENFYLRPTQENPVKLWLNDFDANGTPDNIITYTVDGKDMPVFLKNDMQDQLPVIKKQNLQHEAYAKKSIQELFPEDVIKKCAIKLFNYSASCVAINNGNGNFTIQKLPPMAQLSSLNAIEPVDVNNDGFIDLIAAGNRYEFLPQFERQDASFGHVLINNKNGNFSWMQPMQSGLQVKGEVKQIVQFKNTSGNYFLFLRNNDYPAFYKLKK